jgi:hypothetical protein
MQSDSRPGTASAADIADALRDAAGDQKRSYQTLATFFAEEVAVRHEPPSPTDGPMGRDILVSVASAEVEAYERALADPSVDAVVEVDRDDIHVHTRLRGRLADGTDVDITTSTIFTVAGGEIVELRAQIDPGVADAMLKVLETGGFQHLS